jgi:hypothetical protein
MQELPRAICNIRMTALALSAASILDASCSSDICRRCHAQEWRLPHPAVSGDPVPKSPARDRHCSQAELPVSEAGADAGCGGVCVCGAARCCLHCRQQLIEPVDGQPLRPLPCATALHNGCRLLASCGVRQQLAALRLEPRRPQPGVVLPGCRHALVVPAGRQRSTSGAGNRVMSGNATG